MLIRLISIELFSSVGVADSHPEKNYVSVESQLAEKEDEAVQLDGLIDVLLPAPIQSKFPKNVFMCIYCPKTFTKRDHLTRHERSHTGERPYSCSHCAKRFGDRSTLRQHALLVHSSRLPYECTECGLSFQVRQELKLHRRLHLGVSLHVCSHCGGQFLSRLGLLRHQSQSHNTGTLLYSWGTSQSLTRQVSYCLVWMEHLNGNNSFQLNCVK